MTDLTNIERERIIRDIINHESESRYISGESFTNLEIEEFRSDLEDADDEMLVQIWFGQVGEWLESIGSEYPSFYEAWLDVKPTDKYGGAAEWQFEVLRETGDIEYGYQMGVYDTPYTNVA